MKATTPERQLTWLYLPVANVALLARPFSLLCDYAWGTVPLVESFTDWRAIASALFYTTVLIGFPLAYFRTVSGSQRRFLVVASAAAVLPFLPASNLLFPVGFVIAERVLYLPSIGWCLLVGKGADVLLQRCQRVSRRCRLVYCEQAGSRGGGGCLMLRPTSSPEFHFFLKQKV